MSSKERENRSHLVHPSWMNLTLIAHLYLGFHEKKVAIKRDLIHQYSFKCSNQTENQHTKSCRVCSSERKCFFPLQNHLFIHSQR